MLQTTLPLAKLCAMVTMQKRGEPSVQSFSLPLTPVASDTQDAEGQAKVGSRLFGTGVILLELGSFFLELRSFFWNWVILLELG